MAQSSFSAPVSRFESSLKQFSRGLAAYWRAMKWIGSFLVLGVVVSSLLDFVLSSGGQRGNLADPLQWPPVRALAMLPWPAAILLALVLILASGSAVVAYLANRDQGYFALLDSSAANYQAMRRPGSSIAAGEIAAGFEDKLYAERQEALDTFTHFLNQCDRRILLIVGGGGSGKSTFLARKMGELSGALKSQMPRRAHPCVLINCEDDSLVDLEKLLERIKGKLGKDLRDALVQDVKGRRDRALVVSIDAINENRVASSASVDKLLTDFAQDYLNPVRGFQLYACISVRTSFWVEQRRLQAADPMSEKFGWHNYVYRPERSDSITRRLEKSAETASIIMGDYAPEEFDAAYRKHQLEYEIIGKIKDSQTRSICSNPLMLNFFCRTFSGQDIRSGSAIADLVRDIDLFDKYAEIGLSRIVNKIGIDSIESIVNGETLAQRAVRALLLELALEMVQLGKAFLTDEEVLAVVRQRATEAMRVGARPIKSVADLYQANSVLHALLSEEIVLERRVVREGRDEVSGLRFRYERYFEYSIGRGLARRWRNAHLSRQDIEADFSRLMERHLDLRAMGFNNLREGLGMAILVTEQDSSLPAGIHNSLLQVLARDADFDWNQLACRVIQQLRPFNRPSSFAAHQDPGHRQEVEDLLTGLDELAKKNDFVLRWDIEEALLHGVRAGEGGAILGHLRQWLDPAATFAQRLFAGESLGYLFRQLPEYRNEMVAMVEKAITSWSTLDFWILRSLVFSIGAMLDTVDGRGAADEEEAEEARQLLAKLTVLPDELLKVGRTWWDRSVVLASGVERAMLAGKVDPWHRWQWEQESAWTLVNAALATEQACIRDGCTDDVVGLLRQLWSARPGYDPHLSWAVWHVLGYATKPMAAGDHGAAASANSLRAEIADEARQYIRTESRAEWVLPGNTAQPAIEKPVAVIYHPEYGHADLHNHPESKERVQSILDFLDSAGSPPGGWRDMMTYLSPGRVDSWTDEQNVELLALVHPVEWIRRVQDLSRQLAEQAKPDIVLESDLEVRSGSYEGAVLAVRGAARAMDVVVSNRSVKLAVALVRPPGHLAGNKICIFNNVAVAARHGQAVLNAANGSRTRVLIVDIDAHHGKSTQDIFYGDGSVFYFSIHQEGVHPGTGRFPERGSGQGQGLTVNVPIPAQSGDRTYAEIFRLILRRILHGYVPDLILVSLGLDAHFQDRFSQLNMTERAYAELASELLSYRATNPGPGVVATLEGGYDLYSMGQCVGEFINEFTGLPGTGKAGTASQAARSWLDDLLLARDSGVDVSVAEEHRKWKDDFDELVANVHGQWRPREVSENLI